jgi:hypothetical protein
MGSILHQFEFQVGRKTKNVLLLQIIQVAIEGIVAIKVKRNRSQVQACPGATALIHLSDLKPMRPLDKKHSH